MLDEDRFVEYQFDPDAYWRRLPMAGNGPARCAAVTGIEVRNGRLSLSGDSGGWVQGVRFGAEKL